MNLILSFRPHVWGFFFHKDAVQAMKDDGPCFRPHVWGFFFHLTDEDLKIVEPD